MGQVKFNRMIAANPEFEGSDNFIFTVTTRFEKNEDKKPNKFCVKELRLLDNGWVLITEHDDLPSSCYPPWRIIVLEGLNDCP